MEVLVEKANKHVVERQQRNINITQRYAIWESICKELNPVGKTKRTTNEIKRRRRTKEEIYIIIKPREIKEVGAVEDQYCTAGTVHCLWHER